MKEYGKWMVVVATLLFAPQGLAQEQTEDPESLGRFQELVDEASFPTVESVARLHEQAEAAFESGDCEDAIPILEDWASAANWLANLISQGIDPGYRNIRNLSLDQLKALTPREGQANSFKRERNHAMVMRAECLQAVGRDPEAVATFARVLELIDSDDMAWWTRAANGVYSYIGVDPLDF